MLKQEMPRKGISICNLIHATNIYEIFQKLNFCQQTNCTDVICGLIKTCGIIFLNFPNGQNFFTLQLFQLKIKDQRLRLETGFEQSDSEYFEMFQTSITSWANPLYLRGVIGSKGSPLSCHRLPGGPTAAL